MKLDITRARKLLKTFDFATLFREELGWDPIRSDLTVTVEGQDYRLQTIAHKRGFMALWLKGQIPDYATRRKIDSQVARSYHEHLIIYSDAGQTEQRWQWVKREAGKPAASREVTFRADGNGDALIQKLEYLAVTLDEEEQLTILDVAERVKGGFNVEKVTKKFYERFKDEHAVFMKFLKGIPDANLQRWYVSVTLNRLMFVYFIQKKGFLDGDPDYLRHKLAASQQQGADLFYRGFLCPLFFEGFAKKQHSAEARQLLGRVPYLNGGIFERHQIETLYGEKIEIPDAAFERLFDFFDLYQWHLDERPLRRDNEINPDVLGYIFEKYINQKQMGAYYTKEDITEYISKNTIIPHLFDAARKECPSPLAPLPQGEGNEKSVWRHLQADPARYLYPAIKHGVIDAHGEVIPESALPDFVQTGMRDPNARMFDKRYNLLMAEADDPLRLPTETWREYVYRRQRCLEVRGKLQRGEVTSINDFITLNLDIRQFAQDVIQDSDADLLLAFWKALTQIKILDPTVGSGAFLFAALNVLEPLYEACLERMSALVEELDRSGEKHSPKKYEPFRKALEQVRQRPDEDYFIFKSIIINNLYGVDIMEEAVEICKLRLFLKLASQVEPDASKENLGIEPLPDIDFNIRAGNTLVGFATRQEVERSVKMGLTGGKEKVQAEKLFALPEEDEQLRRIEEKAADVDRLYKLFRQQQTEYGGEVRPEDKRDLQKRLGELEAELNILLARQYGIQPPSPARRGDGGEAAYKKWLASHTPFHWFVEFYGIMKEGGFDVIIGNPPYVENTKVRNDYRVFGYKTEDCGNLYTLVLERSSQMIQKGGRFGMIVPMSIVSTERMAEIRDLLSREMGSIFYSNYSGDAHPSVLFNGVKMRLTIVIAQSKKNNQISQQMYSTKFLRWLPEFRDYLFDTLFYVECPEKLIWNGLIPKINESHDLEILSKIFSLNKAMNRYVLPSSIYSVYAHRIVAHFVKAFDFIPYFKNERDGEKKSEDYKIFPFANQNQAILASAFLNSSLFYYYYLMYSDAYHCGRELILGFPCNLDDVDSKTANVLNNLSIQLMENFRANSIRRRIQYRGTGWIEYDEFYPRLSKPIIDEIDRALARHYGLSDEELDFIINYDIKYRMGASAGEDGDDK